MKEGCVVVKDEGERGMEGEAWKCGRRGARQEVRGKELIGRKSVGKAWRESEGKCCGEGGKEMLEVT